MPPGPRPPLAGGSFDSTNDNSRSSSLDDLHQWVNSAADMTAAANNTRMLRMAAAAGTPGGSGFSTLPSQFQGPASHHQFRQATLPTRVSSHQRQGADSPGSSIIARRGAYLYAIPNFFFNDAFVNPDRWE